MANDVMEMVLIQAFSVASCQQLDIANVCAMRMPNRLVLIPPFCFSGKMLSPIFETPSFG